MVAGIVGAGPARADATSYLGDLHNAGIRDVGGEPALLQTGQKLCVQVSYGATSDQLTALAVQRSDSREGARGLTPLQASELVNYAIADLCPNY
jgi:hypothetical protein